MDIEIRGHLKPTEALRRHGVDRNYEQVVRVAQRVAGGAQQGLGIEECAWVAKGSYRNAIRDRVRGCTHYHAVKMQPRPG